MCLYTDYDSDVNETSVQIIISSLLPRSYPLTVCSLIVVLVVAVCCLATLKIRLID